MLWDGKPYKSFSFSCRGSPDCRVCNAVKHDVNQVKHEKVNVHHPRYFHFIVYSFILILAHYSLWANSFANWIVNLKQHESVESWLLNCKLKSNHPFFESQISNWVKSSLVLTGLHLSLDSWEYKAVSKMNRSSLVEGLNYFQISIFFLLFAWTEWSCGSELTSTIMAGDDSL